MKSITLIGLGAAAVLAAGIVAVSFLRSPDTPEPAAPAEGGPIASVAVPDILPASAEIGARIFTAKCAACHGENAAGKEGFGPPLVHKIYEPGHHGDGSFQLAVQNGVRSHHWPFGNMAPVEGLTTGEVGDIVAYVRALQRHNGIQ